MPDIQALAQTLTDVIRAQVLAEMRESPSQQAAIPPPLLTAKQAGEYIGRSEQAVRHLIHQKEIPVICTGRNVRIDRKDLDAWIENHRC